MAENYDESISALREEIRVLREELAQMRELLKEKDALIAELKEQLRKTLITVSSLPLRTGIESRVRSVIGKRRDGKPERSRDIRDTD